MAPRRLLVVSDEMEVGGSQRQITLLLSGLDRARWQPELLFFREPSYLVNDLDRMGIPVHCIPKHGRVDPGFIVRYAKFLHHGRYDLVHAFSLTAEFWTILTRALVRRPFRFVASIRGLYLTESQRFWLLKRFVISRSDAVIANAHACAAAAAQRVGGALERCDVVPNGVLVPLIMDASDRIAARSQLPLPEGRTFGLFVGRLVKEKNLPCLIRALSRLAPGTRPWMLIAGDGPLRAELEAMVAAEGLADDVSFVGPRRDITALMQAADFLVLPSRQEGASNALLEAMAAGCPVIASAVGGNCELVEDGYSGLLFADDDDHALAGCLKVVVDDPALLATLSRHAKERTRDRHGVGQMVESTTAIYDRCVSDSAGSTVRWPSTGNAGRPRGAKASADPK